MRANRQTEPQREFPLPVVCPWLGNEDYFAKSTGVVKVMLEGLTSSNQDTHRGASRVTRLLLSAWNLRKRDFPVVVNLHHHSHSSDWIRHACLRVELGFLRYRKPAEVSRGSARKRRFPNRRTALADFQGGGGLCAATASARAPWNVSRYANLLSNLIGAVCEPGAWGPPPIAA